MQHRLVGDQAGGAHGVSRRSQGRSNNAGFNSGGSEVAGGDAKAMVWPIWSIIPKSVRSRDFALPLLLGPSAGGTCPMLPRAPPCTSPFASSINDSPSCSGGLRRLRSQPWLRPGNSQPIRAATEPVPAGEPLLSELIATLAKAVRTGRIAPSSLEPRLREFDARWMMLVSIVA